jgi:hypothetical protein
MRRFLTAHPKPTGAPARPGTRLRRRCAAKTGADPAAETISSRCGDVRQNRIRVFTIGEPFALRFYLESRCHMSQSQHYKSQADQAKRLARQVTDSAVREKLLEMAGEYSRYAELMEARERPFE